MQIIERAVNIVQSLQLNEGELTGAIVKDQSLFICWREGIFFIIDIF